MEEPKTFKIKTTVEGRVYFGVESYATKNNILKI